MSNLNLLSNPVLVLLGDPFLITAGELKAILTKTKKRIKASFGKVESFAESYPCKYIYSAQEILDEIEREGKK